jgi:hypothetical protein
VPKFDTTLWLERGAIIVGRRSELRGPPTLSAQKVVPPLPFQKFSDKVEKQPKSAKNGENGEKGLKVPKVSSKRP